MSSVLLLATLTSRPKPAAATQTSLRRRHARKLARGKKAARTSRPKAAAAAATQRSVSAGESGVHLASSSRSAARSAPTRVDRAGNGKQHPAAESEPNTLGVSNAIDAIAAGGSSHPTAGVHMTRARTRTLSQGNSSSSSAVLASSSGSSASSTSTAATSLARSSSSIADNPCDVEALVEPVGRQTPPHEGIRATRNAPKREHMSRSAAHLSVSTFIQDSTTLLLGLV